MTGKPFTILLAAALCLVLATAAMAKTQVYGVVTLDAYYQRLSAEAQVPGGLTVGSPVPAGITDTTKLRMNIPRPWNRFGARWANDDNTLRALIEMRGGVFRGRDGFSLNYMNVEWVLTDNFYLKIGKQTQAFAIMYPSTLMGSADGHTLAIDYGDMHGGTALVSFRGYLRLSEAVRLELQLLDPDNDDPPELTLPSTGAAPGTTSITPAAPGAVTTAAEENIRPRFDFSVPMTFGNWIIEPSGSIATSKYTQVFPGTDDSYNSWGLALGVKWGLGPFRFRGEITAGQNLQGQGYVGCRPCGPTTYVKTAGSPARGIADTDVVTGFAQFGIRHPYGTVWFMYGQQHSENDGNPAVIGDENERKKEFYGLVVHIKIPLPTPHRFGFAIRPEIIFYNNDDNALVSGVRKDFGNEINAGVQFWCWF